MPKIEKHNLNVEMYSLQELFRLFDIERYDNLSIEELKRAKKKVLMTHPDKSNLPAEYFLFYKKAFDIVIRFYDSQNRQNQKMDDETTRYKSDDYRGGNTKQVIKAIDELSKKEFHSKFNQLFEENMTQKPDTRKNEWFSNIEPEFNISENVNSKNMGVVFERIKETQSGMVLYKGVENMTHSIGTKLYDDDMDGNGNGNEHGNGGGNYICSDPFSRLKYDDLRKVHKDQTVFAVSERDFQKVPQYTTMDQFVMERGRQNLTPIEKEHAERMLSEQTRHYQQQIQQKEYLSELRTQKNIEKNKSVLSNFLRLGN
jgi:hypothetical protein